MNCFTKKLSPTKLKSFSLSTFATLGLGIGILNLTSCAPSATQRTSGLSSPALSPAPSADYQLEQTTANQKSRSVGAYSTPVERPGLGTGWGENIASEIGYSSFQRASKNPRGTATIYYNDKEGIEAMTNSWKYKGAGMQKAVGGLVEWGVKGSWGYLKNQHSRGKRFVTGNKGKNYSLVVKNLAHSPLEIVLSVDGLDVIDGQPASVKRRGYIIPAGEKLTIKGFRKSADAVAAFKFSSVNSSYSQLSGQGTTNIGVIGMAVFTQKGRDPWKYGRTELNNRNNARPFAEAPQLRAR